MNGTLLSIERASLAHQRGARTVAALVDVTLDVAPGQFVAVYGRAGSGKTSLLRLAAGLAPPDRGHVRFAGRDLAACSRRELAALHRTTIAWVDRAGPYSRELPVETYVALGLYRDHGSAAARRRAAATLDAIGVGAVAGACWDDLPDSERALVAIAKALVREPRLAIVDDPTHGFGMAERERVLGLLRRIADELDVAVLMAVPDMPATLPAHEVRLLRRGRLVGAEPAPRDPNVIDLQARGRDAP